MASNQTANFGLNQWEPGDQVVHEEFNQDNEKIDAAIPKFITGSYVGTGESTVIHYSLGMRPKLLILVSKNDFSGNTRDVFFFAIDNVMFNFNSSGGQYVSYNTIVTLDDDGFSINHTKNNISLGYNRQGYEHIYWALC